MSFEQFDPEYLEQQKKKEKREEERKYEFWLEKKILQETT